MGGKCVHAENHVSAYLYFYYFCPSLGVAVVAETLDKDFQHTTRDCILKRKVLQMKMVCAKSCEAKNKKLAALI